MIILATLFGLLPVFFTSYLFYHAIVKIFGILSDRVRFVVGIGIFLVVALFSLWFNSLPISTVNNGVGFVSYFINNAEFGDFEAMLEAMQNPSLALSVAVPVMASLASAGGILFAFVILRNAVLLIKNFDASKVILNIKQNKFKTMYKVAVHGLVLVVSAWWVMLVLPVIGPISHLLLPQVNTNYLQVLTSDNNEADDEIYNRILKELSAENFDEVAYLMLRYELEIGHKKDNGNMTEFLRISAILLQDDNYGFRPIQALIGTTGYLGFMENGEIEPYFAPAFTLEVVDRAAFRVRLGEVGARYQLLEVRTGVAVTGSQRLTVGVVMGNWRVFSLDFGQIRFNHRII